MSTVKGEDISNVRVDKLSAYNYTASDCSHGCRHSADTLAYWRERLPNQPATWEGSVLPALRLALSEADAWSPGWTKTAEPLMASTSGDFVAIMAEGLLAAQGTMRLGSLEHVAEDARGLVVDAYRAWESTRQRLAAIPPCPVCQAIAGWAPSCTQCRSGGSATYDPAKVRVSFGGVECVPMSAADAARHEWTAKPQAPEGYTFEIDHDGDVEVQRIDGKTMCVNEDGDELVGVYYYADRPCVPREENADPLLWGAHEAARQYAAHLLGEAAPPLRGAEPTAKPWQPQVGDRVVLESWMGKAAGLNLLEEMVKAVGREAVVDRVDPDGTALVDMPDAIWWWPVSAMRPANMADPRCQTGDSGHSSKTDSPSQAIGVGSRVVLPRLAEVDGTPGFVPAMRELCGRKGVVDDVDGDRMAVRVDGGWAWLWPTALLRPA